MSKNTGSVQERTGRLTLRAMLVTLDRWRYTLLALKRMFRVFFFIFFFLICVCIPWVWLGWRWCVCVFWCIVLYFGISLFVFIDFYFILACLYIFVLLVFSFRCLFHFCLFAYLFRLYSLLVFIYCLCYVTTLSFFLWKYILL
jgi:hypothetical protein